eukprot:CAMPEP_0197474906 /NCGR_PEP_ID=MMETSP1309-20131121/6350_1 /TAXON_ID=464262 /ORGANISM="Genus nov. species nov., Strain RCC998" /LENGTH=888 /DNA_ID=CAMNT_0043014731 /DNA_START=155 /DNA_END=2821 /DNA_ORIENTATION=-
MSVHEVSLLLEHKSKEELVEMLFRERSMKELALKRLHLMQEERLQNSSRKGGAREEREERKGSTSGKASLNTEANLYLPKRRLEEFKAQPERLFIPDCPYTVLRLSQLGVVRDPFESFADTSSSRQNMLTAALGFTSFQRSLLMQERDEIRKCDEHSMFHVTLSACEVNLNTRRYKEIQRYRGRRRDDTDAADDDCDDDDKTTTTLPLKEGPYAGTISGMGNGGAEESDPTARAMECAMLDVPGLPEKEPDLHPGVFRVPEGSKWEALPVGVRLHHDRKPHVHGDPPRTKRPLPADFVRDEVSRLFHQRQDEVLPTAPSAAADKEEGMVESFDWFGDGDGKDPRLPTTGSDSTHPSNAEVTSFLNKCVGKNPKLSYKAILQSKDSNLDRKQAKVVSAVCNSLGMGADDGDSNADADADHQFKATKYKIVCCKGPAGTGKSLTAVKTVAFLSLVFGVRVLLCTPEEYTADLLVQSLQKELRAMSGKLKPLGLGKKVNILRVNDPRRPVTHALADILPSCKIDGDVFALPSPYELANNSIAVCANRNCNLLHGGDEMLAAHSCSFDLCVCDEAGQLSMPDLLVTLTCMWGIESRKAILMLGDEHQLGPSKDSQFESALASWGNENFCSAVIHLERNYRSNQGLLEVPKKMFYGKTLEAVAPLDEVRTPDISEVFDGLDSKGDPASVVTVGVEGKHRRSGFYSKGRSAFNEVEAETIKEICLSFMGKNLVSASLLAVICLSRAQTGLVRKKLRGVGLHEVRCGTVDDFQGQQSDVVLISCVGSSIEALDGDEKRFNVAITRARRLLVVIGSIRVLKDKRAGPWHELAQACNAKGVLLARTSKEEETTIKEVTELARKALLGGGLAAQMFPESLYDHNQEYGWGHTDDDFSK